MGTSRRRPPARVAAVASALALAAGVAACGDGAERDDRTRAPATSGAASRTVIADPPLRGGGDRAAIAEVVDDVQEGLVMGHGASVCRELSAAARRQLPAPAGRDLQACGEVVDQALERWRSVGEEPVLSTIEAIEIQGDEALVTLDVPNLGRRCVRVVNDSRWELPRLDLGHPLGFALLPPPCSMSRSSGR